MSCAFHCILNAIDPGELKLFLFAVKAEIDMVNNFQPKLLLLNSSTPKELHWTSEIHITQESNYLLGILHSPIYAGLVSLIVRFKSKDRLWSPKYYFEFSLHFLHLIWNDFQSQQHKRLLIPSAIKNRWNIKSMISKMLHDQFDEWFQFQIMYQHKPQWIWKRGQIYHVQAGQVK